MSASCKYCGTPAPSGAAFCIECGERLDAQGDWRATVPERLAKALGSQFSIIGELGRGGFAVVYSVRDSKRGRYLAVKVMRPDLMPSVRLMERFRREAQFISQLDHPNILPVLFTGKDEGLVYYAMPRVRGPTLKERLEQDRQLPIDEVRTLVAEMANGLAHAHDRAVVHRDVKPANVMLENGNRVRILDFGIAKALSAQTSGLSVTGEIIGSAEYMSPEQAAGGREIDGRSDIYSVGVVAYQMLTGEPPFRGENFHSVMVQHVTDPPRDPREARPEVPGDLAHAVLACLAKKPEDRYTSAHDLATAVAHAT